MQMSNPNYDQNKDTNVHVVRNHSKSLRMFISSLNGEKSDAEQMHR